MIKVIKIQDPVYGVPTELVLGSFDEHRNRAFRRYGSLDEIHNDVCSA